jgi:hypothetical protein
MRRHLGAIPILLMVTRYFIVHNFQSVLKLLSSETATRGDRNLRMFITKEEKLSDSIVSVYPSHDDLLDPDPIYSANAPQKGKNAYPSNRT